MPRTTADSGIIEIMDVNLRQGFAQVPRPVLRAQGLSVKAKLVYIALLDYAWQQGSCYPGQVRLAADLDVSVDTVQRALAELKRFQLIDWKQRGLNQTNVYRLLPLAENLNLFPDDAGNRNLRLPETAGLRFQETATSGVKNTQQEQYTDESLSNFERSHDQEFLDGADSTERGRRAPEGQETASEALEPAQRPDMPVPAVSRLSGPSNASAVAWLDHSASSGLAQARVEIRSAVAAQMSRDGDGRRRSRRTAPSARPPGTPEEREALAAYLGDFARELGDVAPLSSTITRVVTLFQAAHLPPEQWGDVLYQARRITQERTAQIRTLATEGDHSIRRKNKMPYFLAVLEDLLGLAADGAPRAAAPQGGDRGRATPRSG